MKKIALLFFLTFCFCSSSFAMENLIYILHTKVPDQKAISSLKKNYKLINVLVSQAYQISEEGEVTGFVNSEIQDFAKQNAMKLMVLVTNKEFDDVAVHKFLENSAAQKKAIESVLELCMQNHFYGVQFDFEMVPLKDRDKLTQFFRDAAKVLHAKGFIVSFAVAPVVENNPQESYFQKRLYEVWEGAYDLKALNQFADFVSIMAYNQHADGTTPGPTASILWVEQTIKYALQFLPPQKISIGIATYSGHWYTGTEPGKSTGRIEQRYEGLGYDDVLDLLNKNNAKLKWSKRDKAHYAIYEKNWMNEYLFVEDGKSFQAKVDLAKQYNLRGISVFDIGIEDPKMWKVLAGNYPQKKWWKVF